MFYGLHSLWCLLIVCRYIAGSAELFTSLMNQVERPSSHFLYIIQGSLSQLLMFHACASWISIQRLIMTSHLVSLETFSDHSWYCSVVYRLCPTILPLKMKKQAIFQMQCWSSDNVMSYLFSPCDQWDGGLVRLFAAVCGLSDNLFKWCENPLAWLCCGADPLWHLILALTWQCHFDSCSKSLFSF